MKKGILQPYLIPGYLKRKADQILNTVEGSRIAWNEPGRALLERFQLKRPSDDEILVLTHATLVSPGTERAMFTQQPNTSVVFPYYPGYSGAGEIIMVGNNVTRFKVGDQVAAVLPHASLWLLKEDQVVSIPSNVGIEQACFYQLLIIALQGVRRAQIQLGKSVAVLGLGLIGQLVIQLVASAGAYPITAIATSSRRLALAKNCGAHASVNLSDGRDILKEIYADITIDASGNPQAVKDAIRCTRQGGRVVLLGSNRGVTDSVDFGKIQQLGLTLVGAHIMGLPQVDRSPSLWPPRQEGEVILKLLADGRLDVERLSCEDISPPEAELFYRRLALRDFSALGGVFRWDWLPEDQRFNASRRQALVKGRLFQAALRIRVAPNRRKRSSRGSLSISKTSTKEGLAIGKLCVALIGCGEIGVVNGRAVQEAPNASLAMVMDTNPTVAEEMGKRFQVPYTTDLEELISRDDIDAVLISVPHHLHAPLTIQAAQRGKHVMVEKPMATTIADADAMIAACRKAGVKLSVIYCQRYLPYVKKAKELIKQGALGKILGINLIHYLDKPMGYWTGGRTGLVATDWRLSKDKSGGGILVFNLVHYLDVIRYLTDREVSRVYSEFGTFDSPVDTEDTISISLRYDNHLVGNITAASCVRGANLSHQPLHIWGTEGHLVVGEPFRFYSLHQVDGYNPGEWHTLTEWEWGIERNSYVEHFASAVLRDEEPPVNGMDGRAVQAIVEAVYRSQEQKKPIDIESA